MTHCAHAQAVAVEEAYRLWAPEYDATPNPLFSLEERVLGPLIPAAAGCDAVDLGCGTGRWLVQLARIGARSLTGVDFSPEMLERAAKKLPSHARLMHADCLNTTLASASSDWIMASFLLSYVSGLRELAREAARIARPAAMLLLSDVHPAASSYGWKRDFRSGDRSIEIQTHPYRISDLQSGMEAAGFEPISVAEHCFDGEDKTIFSNAGRPDLYAAVEGLPVLLVAGYRRCRR